MRGHMSLSKTAWQSLWAQFLQPCTHIPQKCVTGAARGSVYFGGVSKKEQAIHYKSHAPLAVSPKEPKVKSALPCMHAVSSVAM